ncbi:MAG: UDP-N-acetylglucosamine--N-acetylmuramyl-(pentapeptide) pyrophosphoryl-undecaprenol [Bacteriovoracaceae bacterium]|nr:UDP-N-acetylglucosamine--N-acetylmuramyl-(pentapeptide) pyrophosphoryl-undecaprenol [Bacteriovoracaceae bacterium]
MKNPEIFICGGGTGGHFFSGVALAEKFLKFYPDFKVTFVGTKNGIEGRTTLSDPRMSIHFIKAKGLKGKGLVSKFVGIFYMAIGFLESCCLLLSRRPKIILGVGGYASAPTVMAAICLRPIGSWSVGILEQNSTPGLANRLFSYFTRAFSAFQIPRFQLIDLPLRSHTIQIAEKVKPFSWPPKTIFILGGSQGAKKLNAKWREALPTLLKEFPNLEVIHQTGRDEDAVFKEFYRNLNVKAEVFAFSNEMQKFYEQADLLICRSGAMTVFEVIAFRRPAVFVPFPFATDDHQRKNALSVQKEDWVIGENDLNAARLLQILKSKVASVPMAKSEPRETWQAIFSQLLRL